MVKLLPDCSDLGTSAQVRLKVWRHFPTPIASAVALLK
jgi:hypothetical protein